LSAVAVAGSVTSGTDAAGDSSEGGGSIVATSLGGEWRLGLISVQKYYGDHGAVRNIARQSPVKQLRSNGLRSSECRANTFSGTVEQLAQNNPLQETRIRSAHDGFRSRNRSAIVE
jgi:hypothetical protein